MRPRPIADPAAVVADEVARLKARFQYPDRAFAPESVTPVTAGGGGGAPTVVVAASDSTEESKARADYICTGTSDENTIQAALTAISTGRVLLCEGVYSISTAGVIIVGTSQTLEGVNQQSVILRYSGAVTSSALIECGSGSRVARLSIDEASV